VADDTDDPTILTGDAEAEAGPDADPDATAAGDDAARPMGRVVQLQRPRSRRRRGSGTAATRPPGGSPDDLDGRDDLPLDDLVDATDGTDGSGADGVIRPTTLRGRMGRAGVPGDPGAEGHGDAPGGGDDALGSLAALHPRMRSRRIAVRRSEGLRRLRRLTWALAGLALLVDGIALAHTGFVDVDEFAVAGTTNVSAAAIEHASGIDAGDALLTLDEARAERRIEELPWVAEADVVRQWPGTVRITVTERLPVAVLQVKDDPAVPLALVDATGRVLEIGAHPEGLIAVTEVPPPLAEGDVVPPGARDALRIAEAANRRMPGAIVSLTSGLEATLGSGGVVVFGSVDDLDTKLMALSTVLNRVDLDCLDSLNLSVPDHPALRRSC
jgi:cell division protein FtsQ